MALLEFSAVDEPQFDFCLWQYPALRSGPGRLRSISLLANSFDCENLSPRAQEIVLAIRREMGDLRTVWGIKQAGAEITWELYFYDYARCQRERSVSRLLHAIRPWVSCNVRHIESHPYFMFSVDFSPKLLNEGGELDELQMYIGNIGSSVSSGICYGITRETPRLKNFYFFFDARREMRDIEGKLVSSAFLDQATFQIESVLRPELIDCEVIVVANKPDRDGVYFSRVKLDQLIWFMKWMEYPEAQITFLEQNRDRLDHMVFDVGFDYRMDEGQLRVVKSAYYGVF